MGTGSWMSWSLGLKTAIYPLHIAGITVPCYAAVSSLALNIAVSVVLSFVFNLAGRATDATVAEDYA
jgi:SSS family solute:Na+ symporter